MFALPKVSTALGSPGTSDCTPTGPEAGLPLSTLSHQGSRADLVPCTPVLLAKVREGQPVSPRVLQQVPAEADRSTRHVSPAPGPPGTAWALGKCLPSAPWVRKQDGDWAQHSHL